MSHEKEEGSELACRGIFTKFTKKRLSYIVGSIVGCFDIFVSEVVWLVGLKIYMYGDRNVIEWYLQIGN
ncbi:predicted protein [Sclerotinia sclerotiorum 1980 UF-70]|uniref:Uncharacterized protein n=1 Tax=Sclerotinia sclerotiorum (strain ATCC 18683 / 1980 / Ss-1) TaxID=665079 RepID=A7ESZ7_SCLS1|nr:predicted protein [Sclerotinia sclerotiorum 1980 UF-70]EDN92589.1 predicted protein [Sclerotinia sclerotiorum 1980 UF-70]